MKYKLRAKSKKDIKSFRALMAGKIRFDYMDEWENFYPEFCFDSNMALDEIRREIKKIHDSNMMVQTINLYEKYSPEF